jgi:ABC-type glycerol-3-phosphate transport system permease component
LSGLIWPFATSSFGIFLLRQTYQSIPDELLEAARLDGASELRIWWRILLPLIRPGLATLAIFSFVGSWNNFLWPLLMNKKKAFFTLPLGLSYLKGFFSGNLRTIAAGVIVITLPIIIVFFIFQRHFIRGLSGAVKG